MLITLSSPISSRERRVLSEKGATLRDARANSTRCDTRGAADARSGARRCAMVMRET